MVYFATANVFLVKTNILHFLVKTYFLHLNNLLVDILKLTTFNLTFGETL